MDILLEQKQPCFEDCNIEDVARTICEGKKRKE